MHSEALTAFERLLSIMDELREKCPWDKKQTLQTLRPLTIEETFELAEAITEDDSKKISEELGDLMLHLVFYARIGAETSRFTMAGLLHTICDKLIARHPHIYGTETDMHGLQPVAGEEDVKKNWEKLKLKEGRTSVLEGVPAGMPPVTKALRMQEKAAKVGFEWENKADVWKKVEEEMGELKEAEVHGDVQQVQAEFGDVLFSLINYARFIPLDPDAALDSTNLKFKKRFQQMEADALQQGKSLGDMSLQEMDAIWNQVKQIIK